MSVDSYICPVMSNSRQELGALAETIACRYLLQKGYELITRNYRKPWGELDAVMRNGDDIIIVEVKANRFANAEFDPENRADSEKLRKVARTATLFIERELSLMDVPWQIDVISVTFSDQGQKAHLKHFKNVYDNPY